MKPALLRMLLAAVVLAGSLFVPAARPAPAQTRGNFVTVQGDQFTLGGKPIKLKGTNFYPKDQPWDRMWKDWNGPAAQADLQRATEIGANSVRILVPYRPDTKWTDETTGQVNPEYLNRLQQMVQMAGNLNMKVIIALFDFYDLTVDHPTEGSDAEARNFIYLDTIVSTFANDDRVMAWDLHNEPDQYPTWKDNVQPEVFIAWMARMAGDIRELDPNHLITVGMSQYDNLYVADKTGSPPIGQLAKGTTVADLSDFLSFHSYNAGNMDWQVKYLKTQSGGKKPILLQETGWPSGPPCQSPEYSEGRQVVLYSVMTDVARREGLAGLMQWNLWDYAPGSSAGSGKEIVEDYYGLLRRDGSWKPAAAVYRDGWPGASSPIQAGPMASLTASDLPLTIQQKPPQGPPDPKNPPPLFFKETGHYIYGDFRDYWKAYGGLEIFGYPLTEQRKEGDYWVQYFERARFEYHDENIGMKPQEWKALDPAVRVARLKTVVLLTRLGADLVNGRTSGKGYPAVDTGATPAGGTRFPETGHSISGKVAEYWWSHNGIMTFGYPLSELVQEVSQIDGKTYTVQYFERTRLELHPENAGTPYEVLLGLMGRELLASKGCGR